MSNKEASSKTMMMVGLALVCCVSLMSVAGGAMWYLNDDTKKKEEEEKEKAAAAERERAALLDGTPSTSTGGDLDGLRRIKYGSVSMVAPSDGKCSGKKKPYFQNTKTNDQHLWNFDPVAGKDDTYYIRSEQRMFKKGCPMYLTAPSSCASNSQATLEKPTYADRQYWKAVPSGDGYQLMSVSCQNARGFPYLVSRGATSGKSNTARMANRTGTTYTIEANE
jgi:hypothetical protein